MDDKLELEQYNTEPSLAAIMNSVILVQSNALISVVGDTDDLIKYL